MSQIAGEDGDLRSEFRQLSQVRKLDDTQSSPPTGIFGKRNAQR